MLMAPMLNKGRALQALIAITFLTWLVWFPTECVQSFDNLAARLDHRRIIAKGQLEGSASAPDKECSSECAYGSLPGIWTKRGSAEQHWNVLRPGCELSDLVTPLIEAINGKRSPSSLPFMGSTLDNGILLIGDSLDRKLLEQFCGKTRGRIFLSEPFSAQKFSAPLCCRQPDDAPVKFRLCQFWHGGVNPVGPYHAHGYMSCGSTSKAVNDCPDEPQYDIRTTHRLSEVLPEFLKHDYNSHGPGLVSVRSLFWDLHRLLDYDEASLRFYDSMDDLHIMNEWMKNATQFINLVKAVTPADAVNVWATTPTPKESRGYHNKRYCVPMNAAARTVATAEHWQLVDLAHMVESLELEAWSADGKHPTWDVNKHVLNMYLNLLLQGQEAC